MKWPYDCYKFNKNDILVVYVRNTFYVRPNECYLWLVFSILCNLFRCRQECSLRVFDCGSRILFTNWTRKWFKLKMTIEFARELQLVKKCVFCMHFGQIYYVRVKRCDDFGFVCKWIFFEFVFCIVPPPNLTWITTALSNQKQRSIYTAVAVRYEHETFTTLLHHPRPNGIKFVNEPFHMNYDYYGTFGVLLAFYFKCYFGFFFLFLDSHF